MHAHYTAMARRDVDGIAEHLAGGNLDAAIRFCVAVEDAAENLAEMPGMGRLREFANPALITMRSWPIKGFGNYLIFYLPAPYGIEILRILHGARDIDAIFEEE